MTGVRPFDELTRRLAEIADLSHAAALLSWDQQVMMPPGGAPGRAEQLATLGASPTTSSPPPRSARLLEELEPFEAEHEYDSFEASLIRVTRRDWEKARKVPSELRAEMSRAAALAIPVWVDARERNDFAAFLPALRENLELRNRYIECFDGEFDEPYDALLDDFEPGMKTAEVRTLFDYLKEHQAPLVKRGRRRRAARRGSRSGSFPLELQKQFELEVVRRFGFDDANWRLDPTVHPFASGAGSQDIRHHDPLLRRQPRRAVRDDARGGPRPLRAPGRPPARAHAARLAASRSGMHESQSRHVGEPRRPLAAVLAPLLPAAQELFPAAFAGYDVERWYREINAVQPSLIRVEADEATYNLHIILRFELEQEMIDGIVPAREPARRSGTGGCGSTSASRCPTTRAASSRTPTGRSARSATSRPTRSGT